MATYAPLWALLLPMVLVTPSTFQSQAVSSSSTTSPSTSSTAYIVVKYNVSRMRGRRHMTGSSNRIGHFIGSTTPRVSEGSVYMLSSHDEMDEVFNGVEPSQTKSASLETEEIDSQIWRASSERVYAGIRVNNSDDKPKKPWIALVTSEDPEEITNNVTRAVYLGANAVLVVDWNEKLPLMKTPQNLPSPKAADVGASIVLIGSELGEQLVVLLSASASVTVTIFTSDTQLDRNGASPEIFQFLTIIVLAGVTALWTMIYCFLRMKVVRARSCSNQKLSLTTQRLMQLVPARILTDTEVRRQHHHHHHHHHHDDDGEVQNGRASAQSVAGDGDDGGSDDHCCIICLESYSGGDKVFVLPCRHFYHRKCIEPWLAQSAQCPVCKLNLLARFRLESVSEESNAEPIAIRAGVSQASCSVAMTTSPAHSRIVNLRSSRRFGRTSSSWRHSAQRPSCPSFGQLRNAGGQVESAAKQARRRSAPARPAHFTPSHSSSAHYNPAHYSPAR